MMMNAGTTASNQPPPGGFVFGNFNNNQQGGSTLPDVRKLFLRKHARQLRKADPLMHNSEAFKAALADYQKTFENLRSRRDVHPSRFTYEDPQRRPTDEDIDDMLCRALDVFAILQRYPTKENEAIFATHIWKPFRDWRRMFNVGDHSNINNPDLLQSATDFRAYLSKQLIAQTADYNFSYEDRRFFRDDVIPAIEVFLATKTASTYYAYMLLREKAEILIKGKMGYLESIWAWVRGRKKTITIAATEDQLIKRDVAGRPEMTDKEIVADMSYFPARAKKIVFVNGDEAAVDQAIKDALQAVAEYNAVRKEQLDDNKVKFIDKYRIATHALANMGRTGIIRDMTRNEVKMLTAYTSSANSWWARNWQSAEESAERSAFLKRFEILPIPEPLLDELRQRYDALQGKMLNMYPNFDT